MCFSATASFGAAIVLSAIGVIAIKKAQRPSQLPLAFIPIVFALQQVSEGFVWLCLTHPEYSQWQVTASHFFMVFAHVVWPVWIPFSVVIPEENKLRKKILYVILVMAVLLSASEIYCMIAYPIEAVINEHHIQYNAHYPQIFITVTDVFYGIVTLIPCFISSTKRMWLLGVALVLSLVIAEIFYDIYLVSVWCFFAAVMSMIVYFIIITPRRMNIRNATIL